MASAVNRPKSMAEHGSHFYRAHFGHVITHSADPCRLPDEWIIFPDDFYTPFEMPIAGRSVAIVGNGHVTGRGRMIDEHDVVIRINYPYQWKRHARDDGEKLTIWAGLGKLEVFNPSVFQNPPDNFNLVDFKDAIAAAESLHCISHRHVQSGFWDMILALGLTSKFQVHWSSPVVFDAIEPTPYGADRFLLSWLTNRCYLENGYGGWYGWDVLLTGVKVLLMVGMSKPASINVFGMNFYNDGYREPWDMHQLSLNLEVFRKIIHVAREIGIPTEIIDNQ